MLRNNDSEMATFLKENDAVLYNQFQRGMARQKKGKELIIAGLIVAGTGITVLVAGIDLDFKNKGSDIGALMINAGVVISIVGPCVILTSIPFYTTGGGLKKRAADSYENQHYINRTSHQPSLDFNFYGNGVGLAFRF
jgi:hypothetical protein